MPDEVQTDDTQETDQQFSRLPFTSIVWIVITAVIFILGTQVVTLYDQERFDSDFSLEMEETEQENTVILYLRSGTFEYNVVPEVIVPAETGTFTRENASPLAKRLFDVLDSITEITIEPQTITIVYDDDIEADSIRSRMRRPVNTAVANDSTTITGSVAEDAEKTVVFTTTDEEFLFGQYTPNLVDETETYASRAETEGGSALARYIVNNIRSIESFMLEPDRIVATYREGTAVNPFTERMTEILNDFYPRASLSPNLWLLQPGINSETWIDIEPIDTGIPLVVFTLLFAVIELGLFYGFGDSEEKLVRPLIRAVGVFLLFWSAFGHEPLWDAFLHQLFSTSFQLLHPQGTVIDFTAQHLELVLVSSIFTIFGGLFFGILVTREDFRELLPLVNNLVNSGQTVPTIAIVAVMAPIIGFGFWPTIIALIAYGLLPVVRNTIAGIEAVSESIIDSARGMGMTPTQILFQVELPVAIRIIMAGIRTSMVINIGTATLGAFVGANGLGIPITGGLAMSVDAFVLLGAIPAALLAILVDYVLGRIEFVLTPRGLQIEQ